MNSITQTVWLAGASGLVGHSVLAQLLRQPVDLHLLLRRPLADLPARPRLHTHLLDFALLDAMADALPAPQAVYICLGTTIAVAGSQAAFRSVDFDAVLAVARSARTAGASRCAVVSALGADANARVFYNRVKGEMEQALTVLGFERLVIARPSLLVGERTALGQPRRAGEIWGERLSRPLLPLIPARWRPIAAERVARALVLEMAQAGPALAVLESERLQSLGTP
jgi:uncharacterized protein YbjT (DUF2867 family)